MGDALAIEQARQRGAGHQRLRRRQYQTSAGEQPHADLGHRRIKTDRGKLQHPRLTAHAKALALRIHQARHPLMGDRDAFRLAGGAGCIDHVGQLTWLALDPWRRRGVIGPGWLRVIELDNLHPVDRQPPDQLPLADQHGKHRILENVGQARLRIIRVQRYVRAAGLEDAQQPHDHLDRTIDAQPHQHVGRHAQFPQMMGQAVSPGVQLAVAQLPVSVLERHGIGRAHDLGFEQGWQRRRRPRTLRCVPGLQHPHAFRLIEQRNPLHRLAVIGHHGLKQALQVARIALRCRPLEQRGGVVERAHDPPIHFRQFQLDIQLRRTVLADKALQ